MTRRLLMVIGLSGLFGVGRAASQARDASVPTRTCRLAVAGMTCGACAREVEKTALKIAGVTSATASQPKGSAEIAYDPDKTSPEAIARAIASKTGFKTNVQGARR